MTYIAVVSVYVLVLLAVSILKSRTVRSSEDFVVAGRGVPAHMLVATLVCTWIGSGSLFGTAGLTFRTGVSELWFSAGAWVGILVVYFIAARVRRIARYTLTDLLERRYGQLAKVLGTVTIIIAYMVIAGYQFRGGGRFISILSEGAISPETGMLMAAVLIIGFTALAGMVSIVSIDVFNGSVMLLAMALTLPFAVAAHGGLGEVLATVREVEPSHLTVFGSNDALWAAGIMLPTFLLLLSESSMYQKCSAARDEHVAKRAVLGMFAGVVIIEILMMSIALVGFAIYFDDPRFFMPDGTVNGAMAEEIILRIGYEQLPVAAGALLLAAGTAIIISTGNTFLMVTSTNVTRDIYEAFFVRAAGASPASGSSDVARATSAHGAGRVTADELAVPAESPETSAGRSIVRVQRAAIIGIGALAYLMMSQFETILEMALVSYTMIGASLAPALLAAFFWKRVTRAGGIASIASGMLTVIAITILNSMARASAEPVEILGISMPMNTDYIALPAVVVSVATLATVSLLTERSDERDWREFFDAAPRDQARRLPRAR